MDGSIDRQMDGWTSRSVVDRHGALSAWAPAASLGLFLFFQKQKRKVMFGFGDANRVSSLVFVWIRVR